MSKPNKKISVLYFIYLYSLLSVSEYISSVCMQMHEDPKYSVSVVGSSCQKDKLPMVLNTPVDNVVYNGISAD